MVVQIEDHLPPENHPVYFYIYSIPLQARCRGVVLQPQGGWRRRRAGTHRQAASARAGEQQPTWWHDNLAVGAWGRGPPPESPGSGQSKRLPSFELGEEEVHADGGDVDDEGVDATELLNLPRFCYVVVIFPMIVIIACISAWAS